MMLRHLWQVEAEERDCDCQDEAERFGKKGCGVSCWSVCVCMCVCVQRMGVHSPPSAPSVALPGARAAGLWLTLSGERLMKEGQALMASR